MARHITTPDIAIRTVPPGWRAALDRYFAGLGQGVNAHLASRDRLDRILALNALSDDELALLGIARDDIPAFVFRDLFPT
ncbi:hypothetical protein [Mesobacterium pallidum]|uniref:hypothetical protein n=1 Tax=Mesobacterium pallidum TaxID=2872037 RepID=UPI001EE3911D|nr:hypothetical protein [Mesobacterium pallidum]